MVKCSAVITEGTPLSKAFGRTIAYMVGRFGRAACLLAVVLLVSGLAVGDALAQTETTGAAEAEEVSDVVKRVGGAALEIFEPVGRRSARLLRASRQGDCDTRAA